MNHTSFPLLKYFSLISFVCIFAAALVLSLFYRHHSIETLVTHGEQSNIVLTRALYNTIWPHFQPFADEASSLSGEALIAHPFTHKIHELVEAQVQKTPVLKIKIFNLDAKTVFSTDPSQLGIQKPANYPGSISARTGRVISKLSHRDSFKAISGQLMDRQVVSSYLPIVETLGDDEQIVGVFEVYFDVTKDFQAIWVEQAYAFLVIIVTLSLLYGSLFFFVRRADKVMSHQENSLMQSLAQIKQQSMDLKVARDEAIEANGAKSAFLANMSHELRTPLNAIIGYSEMLVESHDAFDEESLEDVRRIHKSGKHLLSLINNILDLSKIEMGECEIYTNEFDVLDEIAEVISSLQTLIDANGNTISVEPHGDVAKARTDVTKFHQILYNLIGNANKFTSHGTLTVFVAHGKDENGDTLVLKIKDTGIGIDQEQAETLFEAFKQADSSTTKQYGGTGLGLAITRRLCELMRGRISVESTPGAGSTFTVVLPMA